MVVRAPQIVQSCPFWGTWIYFGEHGKDGKHQPDDKKHPIYDSKYSTCQPDSQGTLLYGIYPMIKKIITYALGEHNPDIILKMGELQAKWGLEPW